MNALVIENKTPKIRRLTRAIVGGYFTIFCGYFLFTEIAVDSYSFLFFAACLGALLGLLLLLSNTLWTADLKLLTIDNSVISSKISGSKFNEEWVKVSKITIGVSYIIFFTEGGRKQRKLDLTQLQYNDVSTVKGKVIELCEYKNIAYIND